MRFSQVKVMTYLCLMEIKRIVAINLKLQRESRKLTQKDIAEKISIDPSVYSRIEAGEIMPTEDKLWKIANLFGIGIEKLFEGASSNIQNNYDHSSAVQAYSIEHYHTAAFEILQQKMIEMVECQTKLLEILTDQLNQNAEIISKLKK